MKIFVSLLFLGLTTFSVECISYCNPGEYCNNGTTYDRCGTIGCTYLCNTADPDHTGVIPLQVFVDQFNLCRGNGSHCSYEGYVDKIVGDLPLCPNETQKIHNTSSSFGDGDDSKVQMDDVESYYDEVLKLQGSLNFIQIQVATNKPTFASSVYQSIYKTPCVPSLAVDGNYQQLVSDSASNCNCFQSNDAAGGPNWLAVDLGQIVYVDRIVLLNRGDPGCVAVGPICTTRLDYFIVGLTNVTPSATTVVRGQYPLCGIYPNQVPISANATMNCSATSPPGRYLIIQQPANGPGYLTICQIQVWTTATVDLREIQVATSKPTFASSVYQSIYKTPCAPSLAADGNYQQKGYDSEYNCNCFHSNDAAGGPNWWAVDLGQIVYVNRVVLWNRGDAGCVSNGTYCTSRLDYFIAGLTNVTPSVDTVVRGQYPLCGIYPNQVPMYANATLNCTSTSPAARYLIIQQPANGPGYLTICQIEVWTNPTVAVVTDDGFMAYWKSMCDDHLDPECSPS